MRISYKPMLQYSTERRIGKESCGIYFAVYCRILRAITPRAVAEARVSPPLFGAALSCKFLVTSCKFLFGNLFRNLISYELLVTSCKQEELQVGAASSEWFV